METRSSPRVLIIDDEMEMGALVARIARRCGYDAITTDDPDDFLDRVAAWEPSLVIIDLVMPAIDGIEIIQRLGKQGAFSQVLLISGFDAGVLESAERLGRAYGLKMVGTLRKPFRTDDLRATLSALTAAEPCSSERLRNALRAGELRLVYQPKYDLATRRIVGVEALARWTDPKHGPIPPSLFIPTAEASGLITSLTRWVVETAVAQQSAWKRQKADLDVAINLSQADLETGDFQAYFMEACRRHRTAPSSFTFEVTETMAMRNAVAVTGALTRLRITGAAISIDDFGTGHSSLDRLRQLPFSEMKVDQAFVADCLQSHKSRVIVRTVIELARSLGLKAVAEGAETDEHVEMLQNLGCELVQGYALSPPVEAEQLPKLVADQAASFAGPLPPSTARL